MRISDKTAISMPMKNLLGIVTAVSVGVWAFFGIQETLNKHSTTLELMEKDLEQNSEFRIKYPRGELGQSAGEAELFMLVEHMAGQVSKIEDRMENMMSNSVNIERLQKDMEKVLSDIEKLKDKQRSFANGTR
jgi:succinate dehydrogenase/fumarate reductase flavoprotein subunit